MSTIGPVLVVGTGLLGTSIGMALTRAGVEVWLSDVNQENVRTASGLGAGRPVTVEDRPALVVVAVPPDHLADEIAAALTSGAVVTDVGSVKLAPLDAVRAQVDAEALTRYVGSHPLAGSERSGPLAASAHLFDGRPWAVTPHEASAADAVGAVNALARACSATVFTFSPEEHDQAVARTSHLPHLVAALVAGRLAGAPSEHLALSGQGVRDVTRIAAGDPGLWQQIVTANRGALTGLLREVRDDLDRLLAALETNTRRDLAVLLERGNIGTASIPGKHGGPARAETGLFVAVPDHPGELARLLADVGEIGVNIEDLRIDHDPGRPVGLVELTISADAVTRLQAALEERGWSTHG
ncbi:MAG TPA: prephenate dehydrogenase [Nocardioidaceae bacterium]|nr:prephenate dehydrogenase [Nocardioidaceae bacterium]